MNTNLVRTPTAPIGSSQSRLQTSSSSTSIHQFDNHHNSAHSTNSQPSRSSDSTQNTSASTLFTFPTTTSSHSSGSTIVATPSPNGAPIAATDNVINRTADKTESLFQMCMNLRTRCSGVPGFEEQCLEVEDELDDQDTDPVLVLWNVFRKGYPLASIYNLLNPADPIEIDEKKIPEHRRSQLAAYRFTQACMQSLGFPQQECFIVTDLKGSEREINMSGFVRVVRQVSRVVDIMISKRILHAPGDPSGGAGNVAPAKRTHRQHVVDELVRTERTYVQHLELLQAFEKHVKQSGSINGDSVHAIFLNLDDLLEFQRRFLVRVEQTNAQPEEAQNWGRLFYHYARFNGGIDDKPKDFRVYEPFIENQKRCEDTTMKEFEKLRQAGGSSELQQMVESPTHLTSFLLKPFQRLSKYPLLLRELKDKGGLADDDERKQELANAIEAVIAVLQRTNAVLDKEERNEAVQELKSQVEDWKHHRVEAFGELLLYGTHTVVKGDPTKDSEREYRMYLFEKILLCCKEMNPNKTKTKMKGPPANPLRNGKPKLQLKGRIFMQNVTETHYSNKPGAYTCKIYWRGDETIESFWIRFTQEDEMKKWTSRIETQRRLCHEHAKLQHPSASDNEYIYLQSQQLVNPYREDDMDDYDQPGYAESSSTQWSASRNASNSSLRTRQRSDTGDSGYSRHMRPTLPTGAMSGLSLKTQQPSGVTSPSESLRGNQSYFSPGAESPSSSRASTASSILGFPRQAVPSGQWQTNESRYTAPAPGRDTNGNYYDAYGRTLSGQHGRELAAIRMRSLSGSDASGRRPPANPPPVPSVPAHLTNGAAYNNRSQTNSPMSPEAFAKPSGGPPRGAPLDNSFYDRSRMHSEDPFHSSADITPLQIPPSSAASPPLRSAGFDGPLEPSQLKVKVKVPTEGSTMMLVVSNNISYEMLRDRIDHKLQRNTAVSLSSGSVKLKYLYDEEYVSIQTDEDVQTAFETWREEHPEARGQHPEIELFCHPTRR